MSIEDFFSKMVNAKCINWCVSARSNNSGEADRDGKIHVHAGRIEAFLTLVVVQEEGKLMLTKGDNWVANEIYHPAVLSKTASGLVVAENKTTTLNINLLYGSSNKIFACLARTLSPDLDKDAKTVKDLLDAMGLYVKDMTVELVDRGQLTMSPLGDMRVTQRTPKRYSKRMKIEVELV